MFWFKINFHMYLTSFVIFLQAIPTSHNTSVINSINEHHSNSYSLYLNCSSIPFLHSQAFFLFHFHTNSDTHAIAICTSHNGGRNQQNNQHSSLSVSFALYIGYRKFPKNSAQIKSRLTIVSREAKKKK